MRSARLVVPVVLKFVNPKSVIDVGCGSGAWLKAFQENGVQVIHGVDGPWVKESRLLIHRTAFTAVDLTRDFEIEDQFDLAVCLEVAEHLPPRVSRSLVRSLTAAAPLVLFSAAVPGQGGTGHVNEQWPAYWRALFAERGFGRLDPIRRKLWQDGRVEWWYRQNLFLYASGDAIGKSRLLQAEVERVNGVELEVIHADILARYSSLSGILHEIPRMAWRSAMRRVIGWRSGPSNFS